MTISAYDPLNSGEILIGARLRAIRCKQKLSIRTLARKCGISANTLSLIENDRTSPSLHTLQLLAHGLDIPLTTIFEKDKPAYALVFQQQEMRTAVRFAHGTLENLGEGLPPLGAEPILVRLEPNCQEVQDISHAGREFIYCLEGNLACFIAGQSYLLSPGDSLLFDARAPHHWQNISSTSSRLLVLFCPIEAHDHPIEQHLGY